MLNHKQFAKRNGFMPKLEVLEDRWCPSAASVAVHNGTLIIHTAHANDTIAITDDGLGHVSATISGAESASASGDHIHRIVIMANGGNDSISYHLTGNLAGKEDMLLRLNDGHDSVNLDFGAGVSADHLGIHIDDHGGNDAITASFGTLKNTSLRLWADFFRGNDSFTLNLNGNVTGDSNARFDVHGFRGNDVFVVNAPAVNIDVAANLAVNLEGRRGNDQMNVTYEGQVDGNLSIGAHGHRGNDSIAVNITADKGSNGDVVARVSGDFGDDTLTLNVNDNSGNGGPSTLHHLSARIRKSHGTDTVTNTPNVTVVS
jgi:hypothetical protein